MSSGRAVVVGASHAGAQLVTSLRQGGWSGEILLVGGCALGAAIASMPMHSIVSALKSFKKMLFSKDAHVEHMIKDMVQYAETAREFGLAASRGSDFHSPGESHTDLGQLPFLPGELTPVWEVLADRIQ